MTGVDTSQDSDAGELASRDGRREEAADYEARLVVTLGALALAVRLVWILAVPTHPVGDFAMYWESAGHLVEHGAFDPQFIYMPGYVVALAAVRLLGGGLFAAKLLGVAAGGLATAAVTGLAARLFDHRAAVAAGLLCALWPAGITIASVVGTDMPAAALLVTAAWLLVRDADARPVRAAVLFGLALGVAAYVRAVALPFALFSALIWVAVRAPWRRVVGCTALSCAVVFLMLLPWGVRNELRYGELFLTDSHGGHTALVGANPNTDGVYSRSLNLMFARGTGYALFAEPHREADRAAYDLARKWAAFEPDYAFGLLGAKADRLLTHERPLLYWPIYRQGVLGAASQAGFARHQAGLERLVDAYWYALVGAAFFGVVVAASRRKWEALALLSLPLALSALYVLFFAEVRYHLAIAVFLFPYAGLTWRWFTQAAQDLVERRLNVRGRRRLLREGIIGAVVLAALFVGWPRLVAAGAELRDRHRWAVSVCSVDGHDRLCAWKPTIPAPGEGPSGVRGVWNGFGLKVATALAAAATEVDLPPGRYRVTVTADSDIAGQSPEIQITLRAHGKVLETAPLPPPAGPSSRRLSGVVEHLGGALRLEIGAARVWTTPSFFDLPSVWISDLKIEADVH
ncbi:MAG TPA: glycosyltransferase family 39 protein [Polyangia bacterium]|nr:glycosyltransferase family 39 protein [Polyangia bacterium]